MKTLKNSHRRGWFWYSAYWLGVTVGRKVNRVHKAKDEFGIFIHQAKLAVPQVEIWEWYNLTKPEIRDEVGKLKHFLGNYDRDKADGVLGQYLSLFLNPGDLGFHKYTGQDLGRTEGQMGESLKELAAQAYPPLKCKTPYETIQHHLDEFYKLSK